MDPARLPCHPLARRAFTGAGVRPISVSDDREPTTALPRRLPPAPLATIVRVGGARARPAVFVLRSGVCLIGAAPDADIVIDDPTVSRRHLELELVPEGVALRDLGSRNGTFVAGHRVERATVAPGTRVLVGAAELSIEVDASSLSAPAAAPMDGYCGLIGRSSAMQRLYTTLGRLEGSLVPVLIEGESGVGKELVARAIHEGSTRSAAPFVVVNCGAIARDLVLSDLFGHKKGAFTGAVEAKSGAFQAANGGTLFLDEVGELPLDMQPSLLRALESGEVRPLGEVVATGVDVRVVAATNRDLTEEVRQGRFREDLFYRLAVVRVRVAPLRERTEDIPSLARRFAAQQGLTDVPPAALAHWAQQPFRGNVRELRNAVAAFAAIGALDEQAALEDALEAALARTIDASAPYADQKEAFVATFSRAYLRALLAKTAGNQSEAARIAGLDRGHLGRMLTKLGVDRERKG
jgi:two-component system response regulator GlrR